MTRTTESLGGSAAVDDAARSVTRPFYAYAVLANTLFIGQGVGMACVSGADTALLYDLLVRRGATAAYVKINSRFTMLRTVTSGAAIVLGGQLQRISWGIVYVGSAASLVTAAVALMSRVPFAGGLTPLLSDRADRRIGYRVIVPVSLLALAVALGLSGLGLVWSPSARSWSWSGFPRSRP
ncbi:hypothetical protein AB0M92_33915 [Streptomyces sp. NPDC051582]|uniref:hypothetical protein n=1 Tax=Streptomyces sp. NPDC051582 TaxID=3155167 RepID=UPI003434C733